MGSGELRRLERQSGRLAQARTSIERLCLELREELLDAESRNERATAEIRRLRRDAERRDNEFATARRRVRLLLKDAERRDNEFATARRRVRLLLKDAERRDNEFAQVRRRLRALQHLSSALADGFLAITEARRWRLGHTLLSIPSRTLGRRPKTVADELRPLAVRLALGQLPSPDPTDHLHRATNQTNG